MAERSISGDGGHRFERRRSAPGRMAGDLVARRGRRLADGSVRVHYTGWDDSWHEDVPRVRLQLLARGERMVTLHLDRGWALSGKLLEITPDGYWLYRAEDHKVCVVNKQSVAYLEVDNPSREYQRGIRANRP